jgi:hypothetical protein
MCCSSGFKNLALRPYTAILVLASFIFFSEQKFCGGSRGAVFQKSPLVAEGSMLLHPFTKIFTIPQNEKK